jgi:hypothetical protein
MGADPWALHRLPSGAGWVGILRGRSAVVLLDDELREVARAPAPRAPSGLALAKNGDVLVVGELSPNVARFAVRGPLLVALGEARVPGVFGLRDVAVGPAGTVWALDEHGGRVLRVGGLEGREGQSANRIATVTASVSVGRGATQVRATARHVVVDAVAEHRVTVIATDAAGAPAARAPLTVAHDGPLWGFDARETDAGLVLVAGGVEDHPLDRKKGFFGYVDSFVFVLRVREGAAGDVAEQVAALNVSEHGVITPKALVIEAADRERIDVLVTGYGSAIGARVAVRDGAAPTVAPLSLVPGVRMAERAGATTAMADPLLDAWVKLDDAGVHVVSVPSGAGTAANEPARSSESRLGEALVFTSLMAPGNTSAGAHSRFTCETCHFEGYVDGRTHHTGREDVHATTKPLVGLVGNRPYFSRALDPDLSTVSHAEFRVAGAGTTADPFFAVEPRDHRWLEHIGVTARVEALDLRRALMRYLTDLSHRPNPAAVGRTSFEPLERAGARIFERRCERCHASRLSADDAASRVRFEEWESLVLRETAPIVWGSAGYQKTGVTPYVHADGARTPSLRRLHEKFPYFTNGSACSLDDVLDRVRFSAGDLLHDHAPEDAERLDAASKRALRAFLELL